MNPASSGDEVQLVVFRVGEQHFAVSVFETERILRYQEPTPLPEAPDFLEGMLAYGEGAIPLVDLRKRLDTAAPIGDDTRVVVLDLAQGKLGIVVDAVLEVNKVPAERIAMPPETVQGLAAEFNNGIVTLAGRATVILAVSRLLSSAEHMALDALVVETGND
jgi:purine-binding chemotaxis protein CheW